MIYNIHTRELRTNDGKLLKTLFCPLHKRWSGLKVIQDDPATRHCDSCNKLVMNLAGMSDQEAEALFQEYPLRCVFISPEAKNIKIEGYKMGQREDPCPIRRIQTARGEEAIHKGVKAGYWPLVKKEEASSKITSWMEVYQDENTGEIMTWGDHRWKPQKPWKLIIKPFRYYPGPLEHHIAAYLLPSDLAVGERVFLVDLIENLVGVFGNQGHTMRLESAYAIWDGKDFKIQWNEQRDADQLIG